MKKATKGEQKMEEKVKCSECPKEIKSQKVIDYSFGRFGKPLCMDCQQKRNEVGKKHRKERKEEVMTYTHNKREFREGISVRQTSINASARIVAGLFNAKTAPDMNVKVFTLDLAEAFEKWISR